MPSILLIHPTNEVTDRLISACQPLIHVTCVHSLSDARLELDRQSPVLIVLASEWLAEWASMVEGTPVEALPKLLLVDDQSCWGISTIPASDSLVFAPYTEWELRMRLMMTLPWPLLKVLVVQSSGVILDGVWDELEWSGVECHRMNSDQGLSEQLERIQPNVLVVDTEMPEFNRQAVVVAASQYHVPILGVFKSTSFKKVGRSMGYHDFIAMPIRPVELLYRVHQLMRRSARNSEAGASSKPLLMAQHQGGSVTRSNTVEFPMAPLTDVMVTLQHEINSPLTGIKLGAQTLEKRLAPSEQVVAREIVASAKRIESTLDRLQTSQRVTQDIYMNGTTMAVFETEPFPWA